MSNAELKFLEVVPSLLKRIADNTERIADALDKEEKREQGGGNE